MSLSARFSPALALGISLPILASAKGAELPAPDPSPPIIRFSNQEMAESIAARLRQSGLLQHYDIDVRFRSGVAELTGTVSDAGQRDEVLRLVRTVPGVQHVIDGLHVAGSIVPVQAGGSAATRPPLLEPPPAARTAPPVAGSRGANATPLAAAPPPEATPIFQAPAPVPNHLNPPRMPPYAWPTYAPYNNYSRVGYPLAYPYNSFPFIGPVYPFPKVPLGWRSVRLEWDDGFWWFSKTATRWDWWKLRYY